MRLDPVKWLQSAWLDALARAQVAGQYRSLKNSKHLLADIARRGGVFASNPPTSGDVFEHGRREGRRELALEIIEMVEFDPAQLLPMTELGKVHRREEST